MKSAHDRFWAKVQVTDGCWEWQNATNGHGYGIYWYNGRLMPAHVFSWEEVNGPVPDGLVLDHVVCDNRPCVRPDHLTPTTSQANIQRSPRWFGNRTECPQGHRFDEKNTYIKRNGGRDCRACNAARSARLREMSKKGTR